MGSMRSRSLLVPGVALATVGAVALGPTLVTPPAATLARPALEIPAVQVQDLQLAGIGRDIYDSITQFVQYVVESSQFWIDLIPGIGPPLAQQVGINYFDFIQPVIANTVYYISDLIADPASFVPLTVNYGSNLFYTGYNWVSQQAQFFGQPALPPIPQPTPLASVAAPEASAPEAPAPEAPAASAVAPPGIPAAKARADRADRRAPSDARNSAARRAATSAASTARGESRKAAAVTRGASRTAEKAASEAPDAAN